MEKDLVKQIRKYEKQRARAQEKGNLKEEAESLNFLGELYTELGDHDESLKLHKQELSLCHASGDKIGQAVAHRKIGECYASLSNYTKALQHQHRHLELAKVAGSLPEQQRAFTTIGRTYLIQGEDLHTTGNYDQAKPLFKKAESAFHSSIRLSQSLQEARLISEKEVYQMKTRSITNLALAYHYISLENNEDKEGSYAKKSVNLFQKALSISQKHMLSAESHQANVLLTTYHRARSEFDEAIARAEEAHRSAKVARNVSWQIEALNVLGELQLLTGNSKASKKAFKKSYRLTTSSEGKSELREKLKTIVKIHNLQSRIDDNLTTVDKKFKFHDKIADNFCDMGCYQAAIKHYKEQELLFPLLDEVTEKQRASVYYSLALTNFDLNDFETAIEYYKKEMEFYTEPKELAKTWTQIGICTEKSNQDSSKVEECYEKAVEYAKETGDCKLQLKALNLLLEYQIKFNLSSSTKTRRIISDIQLKSGLLVVDNEEDSEDICGSNNQAQEHDSDLTESDSEDSEDLLEKELKAVSSDDSDVEESRKSRITSRVWKRKLNEKGETPLHRACIDGHMKRVQLLLEQGHPVNEPDYAGWMPLHEACNHGFVEIVRVLVNHGANINYAAKCGGTTPMQDAATNGHLDIVALLLENGADPRIKNKEGQTPLGALDAWFSRSRNDLDSYEIESYQKIRQNLSKDDPNKENVPAKTDFGATLGTMDDLFDNEICTQQSIDAGGGLTQTYERGIPDKSQKLNSNSTEAINENNISQNIDNFSNFSQKINEFDDLDLNFNDSQILPTLDPRPRISKLPSSQDGDKELFDATGEYKKAMENLGGSDKLSKTINTVKTSSRAPKRPSTDDFEPQKQGLIGEEEYTGDDWLIDDLNDAGSNPTSGIEKRPFKRPKTVHLSGSGQTNFGNYGWKKTNSIKKTSKDTNSGSFSSSFLNRSNIREKSTSKKLITTKIRDFIPENDKDDIIIEDDDEIISTSVPRNISQNVSVPSSSFVMEKRNAQIVPQTQPTQVNQTMRVKVKINGKMFLIAVPGSSKTIGWLCDRASLVYKQNTGLQPKLSLYSGGMNNEEEACLLSNDDIVSDVLQTNEHVTAKIESWVIVALSQKYEEACQQYKQVANPTVLNACHQSTSTGRIDLKNQGLSAENLKPLVSALTQQEITSLVLPGNSLRDDGVTTLCESLQRQMSLDSPSNKTNLTELNLKCSNLTQAGLRKLSQLAKSGALKDMQTLDISYNRFGDYCCEDLATILQSCTSLKNFYASRCRFSNKLFQVNYPAFRSAMQGCVSLHTVDFSHNKFGSVGIELLLKSLPLSTTTTLVITGICDAANNSLLTRHIISYLKLEECRLHTLHLASNHLSQATLSEIISELKKIPHLSLRSLDISKNNITRSGEMRLASQLSKIDTINEVSNNSGHHAWKANKAEEYTFASKNTNNTNVPEKQLIFV